MDGDAGEGGATYNAAGQEVDENGNVIEKSGWLIREVHMEGSQSSWKKQWNTLTLHELRSYKSNKVPRPCCKPRAIQR